MIDRNLSNCSFKDQQPTGIHCPTCNAGKLIFTTKKTHCYRQAWVKDALNDENFFSEWSKYTFASLLECSDSQCQEVVSVSGIAELEEKYGYDEDGYEDTTYEKVFKPKYFYPPLKIFNLPHELPEEVREEIFLSFESFFFDPQSSANHVRKSIEHLLSSLRVKRYSIKGGKRTLLKLHHRIQQLPSKYKDSMDHLIALKWIGNAGSHFGSKITQNDVLDSYEILEYLLNQIYRKDETRIQKLVGEIIKRKGPVKKRK